MKSLLPLCALAALTGCTSIQTRVEIAAPAEKVRAVAFDFKDYPAWNPFIVKIDGAVAPGNTVNVTVKPVGKNEISGETKVLTLESNRVVWRGSLAIPGLFRGEHEFVVESAGPNRTIFLNREKMSGLVIPFYNFGPTKAGFDAMNEALKRRAEGAEGTR